MADGSDDRAFIETQMFHGRRSRQPLRRWLGGLLVGLLCIAGALAFGTGAAEWDGPDRTLFTVPLPGGRTAVTESQGFAVCLGLAGLWALSVAVRGYRGDRAIVRRIRGHERGLPVRRPE